MTTISLRMDDQMKKELDEMCEAMGMNYKHLIRSTRRSPRNFTTNIFYVNDNG